jgi:ubiquinone/menaquinone biosynthesis C-methylase UbiE
VSTWLPALEGVVPKLERGAKVADVGCGHGASTVVMAQAFPKSSFVGFDYHAPSVATAQKRARDAGVDDRATFVEATAKTFPGNDFDLVCFFDCLHDMGDPVGAAKHACNALKQDGTVLLVEPFANDRLEDNMNPVGRMFYARRRSSARRTRCPKRSGLVSARRPVRHGCKRYFKRRASSSSGA